MTASIYWYDLETTGTDSRRDRPLQFAGVRTNLDLEIVAEAQNFFCRPGDDILPDPEAICVTGIDMDAVVTGGLNESAFAAALLEELAVPETCVAGFNNIRFDDEFVRQMLYRNFFEPYSREWRGGNSRWDVIDLLRTARALRPEGINWPQKDDGAPSFRLEDLTRANNIHHDQAHDALADVRATIKLVKKVRQAQPRLYDYVFRLRSKEAVLAQLYPLGKQALVHVSGMYAASRGCASLVLPLCQHPSNGNGIICVDLTTDPSVLIDATADEVHRLVFTKRDRLDDDEGAVALKTIHINRCPSVAPTGTLDEVTASRLGIDKTKCLEHMRKIQRVSGLVEKVQDAFSMVDFDEPTDPDLMLYAGGFFSDDDQMVMEEVQRAVPATLADFENRFRDDRLNEMLFRYRARNFPETLSGAELTRWRRYKRKNWAATGKLSDVEAKLAERLADSQISGPTREVLEALGRYIASVRVEGNS